MIDFIKLEAAMRELASETLSSVSQRSESGEMPAAIDPVTYVYSREFFELQLGVQLNMAKRQRGLLVIFAIEIDNLAQLAEDNSHDAINRALRKVAKCLSGLFRRGTDFIARTDNNQFMVLTLSMSKDQAEAYLPAIRCRFREIQIGERYLRSKISMSSCAPRPTDRLCTEDLIESVQHDLRAEKFN